MKVKNHEQFIKSIPGKFEVGDVLFIEEDMEKPRVEVVIGIIADGSVITDKHRIVDNAEIAEPLQIEAYRNNLIPAIEGLSYVSTKKHNGESYNYVAGINPRQTFENVCDYHDIPTEKGVDYAGGIAYDCIIELIHN